MQQVLLNYQLRKERSGCLSPLQVKMAIIVKELQRLRDQSSQIQNGHVIFCAELQGDVVIRLERTIQQIFVISLRVKGKPHPMPLFTLRVHLAVPRRGLRYEDERDAVSLSDANNCQKIASVMSEVSPGRTTGDRSIHSRAGLVSKFGLLADLLEHLPVGLRTEFVYETKDPAPDLKIGRRVFEQ